VTTPREQTGAQIARARLEDEVGRIVAAADGAGLTIRVLGSIGVAVHCAGSIDQLPGSARTYADIDFVAYRREARGLGAVLTGLGYLEDREIFITSEGRRAIFVQPGTRIHVDVFFDRLEFCHVIPIDGRLGADRPTVPLAELLLSKLQIVRINEKDVADAALLLLDHDLGPSDSEQINVGRIAGLVADDWGLWRTLTMNLEKVDGLVGGGEWFAEADRSLILDRARRLKSAIDAAPKSLGWRMRARVGDRTRWWTEVDEVR
jgi:hypothetical protein